MIYTVTLNPAIDYVTRVRDFVRGETNRSYEEQLFFGGKGVNVSLVLNELGVPNTALGFVGGETGEMFVSGVRERGLNADFIRVKGGRTRINVKLKEEKETEINATGPVVSAEEQRQLLERLVNASADDIVVLAGSLPKGIEKEFYATVMAHTAARVVVDATGDTLRATLPYRPLLIKPNIAELADLVGRPLTTIDEITEAARDLQASGAVNVMVSCGGDGLILFDEHGDRHQVPPHQGTVVNTVGAGDSTVAGFLYGIQNGFSYAECARFANACGAATAFSDDLATREKIEILYKG